MRNNLKEIRLKKNISSTELAKTCGVSRQTIYAIEIDKYTPSVELAIKVSRALKSKVEKIFILEDKSD